MRIFFSAGEASGDAYAAALVGEIRRLHRSATEQSALVSMLARHNIHWNPSSGDSLDLVELVTAFEDEFGIKISEGELRGQNSFEILGSLSKAHPEMAAKLAEHSSAPGDLPVLEGVGGKQLSAAGVNLIADSGRWGAIGIAQALKVVPRAARGLRRAKAALLKGEPGLLIAIDFGFFNIKLARHAKQNGWKVLYFMPPGSWRRDRQGKDLPAVADEIVTPFPWSAELLENMGARVHWYGHPLKQLIAAHRTGKSVRDAYSIAILPGSREHEIDLNLPAIAEGIRAVAKKQSIAVEFSVAPSLRPDFLKSRWEKLSGRMGDKFTQGDNAGILSRSHAAVVCSGTATLEAALCGCPMVIVYNVSPGMAFQGYFLHGRPEFIGLPNILLRRMAVPELVHHELTGENLSRVLGSLLDDSEERQRQLTAFHEIDEITGPDDAITKTAELALVMAAGR